MLRRYSVNFELFSILLDMMSVIAGLSLGGAVHPWIETIFPFIRQEGEHDLSRIFFLVFPIAWIYVNLGLSLYDGRKNLRFLKEMLRLMLATVLASVSLAGLLYFVSMNFAHSVFIAFLLISGLFMVVWRSAVRLYWRLQYSSKHELRRVLIVGAGKTGRQMATNFLLLPTSDLEIVGYLDDDPRKLQENEDVIGTTNDLERVVSFYHITILVIALPPDAFALASNIVDRLRMTPVKIWVVPAAQRLALNHCNVEYLEGVPLIDVRAPSITDEQRLLKRIFDLLFSSVAVILCAPLFILIAILIKLDSPGPVFFHQKRVGENTQPFEMLKFRTMVQNAEALSVGVEKLDEQGNILHKHRDDPRITRVGRFLRRFSIDELPQIFNVFLGNMSMVGPRPELPYLVERYKSWQYVRFTVPQGITGWWQITGRSDKPMHLNTEDDLYYIKNCSIWLDIKILTKTLAVVISGRGAF